jgi:predicted  nucleic acid-binding Zn-ribbon protein
VRESLRKLVDLWRADDALAGVEAQLGELPERRAAGEREQAAADAAVAEARAALAAREKEHQDHEKRLAAEEEQIRRLRAEQGSTKDNQRYRAIDDFDIPAVKHVCEEIETRILEASYAVDDARRTLKEAEQAARAVAGRVAGLLAQLDARAGELGKEIQRLREARAGLASLVEPELRAQYERVAARRRPALAMVSGDTCTGCRVGVPPKTLVELLSAEQVVVCESCKRILIHPDLLTGSA